MAPASGVTQKSGTTTLSTIVLRSKETQVVIALLRSGSEIDLKVLYIIYIGIYHHHQRSAANKLEENNIYLAVHNLYPVYCS